MAAPLRVGGSDAPLIDSFGRRVSYLRVSITDRCDLRCTYCMPERMTFLPKDDVLSFEELDRIVSLFAQFGVDKLRVTGGEPLVRRDVMALMRRFARHIEAGALRELTLTTNGTLLERYAAELADIGVKRINVSLDTLDRGLFEKIARRDRLEVVLAGIAAAAKAGLKVKINTVAMKGVNDAELPSLIAWAHGQGHDMTLIETMPMGEAETDRVGDYLSLSQAREELRNRWTLTDIAHSTGGPARYVRVEETGGRLGFITPLSHNFCESCNRVRLTCTGRLYTCLGREDGADLRAAVREHADDERLETLVRAAIGAKPRGHDFDASRLAIPASPRTMSHTGG
ncbi:GTP 3',8-cyclase MoaA [bacterium]|nr:GTP 3',8-cyclase MoaA [bacterium]